MLAFKSYTTEKANPGTNQRGRRCQKLPAWHQPARPTCPVTRVYRPAIRLDKRTSSSSYPSDSSASAAYGKSVGISTVGVCCVDCLVTKAVPVAAPPWPPRASSQPHAGLHIEWERPRGCAPFSTEGLFYTASPSSTSSSARMASPNKQGVKAEYCIFDVDGLLSGSKRRTRGHSSELMDAIDGFPRSVRSRWPASIRETDAVEHPCLPSSDTEVRIDCLRIWRGVLTMLVTSLAFRSSTLK